MDLLHTITDDECDDQTVSVDKVAIILDVCKHADTTLGGIDDEKRKYKTWMKTGKKRKEEESVMSRKDILAKVCVYTAHLPDDTIKDLVLLLYDFQLKNGIKYNKDAGHFVDGAKD